MRKPTYPRYKAGEPVNINWRRQDFRWACCDCGVVHLLRFAVAGERLRFRVWRDNRRTGQLRRWQKLRVRTNGRPALKKED